MKWVTKLGFKKIIKALFPECEINEQLKDKIYIYEDIERVVNLGNQTCKKE